jgi:hypothetical protein
MSEIISSGGGGNDIMSGGGIGLVKKTFFNHVFSTSDEGKAEIFNVLQYSGLALIPVVILNKLVQRFIPDADPDKSSLEILFEVLLQLIVLFIGIILIHRTVTFVPTYSGYKYECLSLTGSVLTFLIIILSIQTKLGIKVSILFERVGDLWSGTDSRASEDEGGSGSRVRVKQGASKKFNSSQADFIDNPQLQNDLFPPAPTAVTRPKQPQAATASAAAYEPVAANSLIGSAFGSLF